MAIFVFSRSRGMIEVVVVTVGDAADAPVVVVVVGAESAVDVEVTRASFSNASFTSKL
jgi:hypothetical protein